MDQQLRIGIDIGGTFTDFVIYDLTSHHIESFKLLSTPMDPAQAVIDGVQMIVNSHSKRKVDGKGNHPDPIYPLDIIHGSTIATNALLERKGARTGLITTLGFKDVLQIGRQNRPELYDFFADPPPPIIPEDLRFEIDERVDNRGDVLKSPDVDRIDGLIASLQAKKIDSVAVCFLFSFLRPENEKFVADKLRQAGFLVSPSHEILPEYREYERMSTTAVNAYVSPILDRYLAHLEDELINDTRASHLRVMQSNGGMIGPEEARRKGVHCILSGPAGGVVGAHYISRLALCQDHLINNTNEDLDLDREGDGKIRVITFDMGGTSTDVSLIEDSPKVTTDAEVGGCPIRVPVLDIHTIGAGGGSIAFVDKGGALRVGPESAGANPGPACYGIGDLPTVTDANLVLGRLLPEFFLGGKMQLDVQRARNALSHLGLKLSLDEIEVANGIIAITNAHMERALRVISVERGYDPRYYTLLSFGGAGGLHAGQIARSLGIKRVMIPPLASTLSAFGMLAADIVKDYTQTVMLEVNLSWQHLEAQFDSLVERGIREVEREGIANFDIDFQRFLDMRYQGQSYELTVPFTEQYLSDFHELHDHTYGYTRRDANAEIVNVRVRVTGKVSPPQLTPVPMSTSDPASALLDSRIVSIDSYNIRVNFYQAERLLPGFQIFGPAIIVRADTTILVDPQSHAFVDVYRNIILTIDS